MTEQKKRRQRGRSLNFDEYRRECLKRNPDYKKEHWDSMEFTIACAPDDLRNSAAVLDSARLLRAAQAQKFPRLFDEEYDMLLITSRTTDEEALAVIRGIRRKRKWDLGRSRKRTHGRELAFRLQVFDSYHELGSFTQVASCLGATLSNVRRAYAAVYEDIFVKPPPRRRQEKMAVLIDPGSHLKTCSTCRSAQDVTQMCSTLRAYAEQDYAPLVGVPVAAPEKLERQRKQAKSRPS